MGRGASPQILEKKFSLSKKLKKTSVREGGGGGGGAKGKGGGGGGVG